MWRHGGVSKYGNKPKRCAQNLIHQSTLEADQCDVLHILQAAGKVSELQAHPQPRYPLVVKGVDVGDIIPDFEFVWTETGEVRTIDTKGFDTEVAKLKRKLFFALYGREIELVRRPWAMR